MTEEEQGEQISQGHRGGVVDSECRESVEGEARSQPLSASAAFSVYAEPPTSPKETSAKRFGRGVPRITVSACLK
jgi:hypothetical protein